MSRWGSIALLVIRTTLIGFCVCWMLFFSFGFAMGVIVTIVSVKWGLPETAEYFKTTLTSLTLFLVGVFVYRLIRHTKR